MLERTDEKQTYPFQWLDETVEVTLNPARSRLKTLPADVLKNIAERLPGELALIANRLKTQAFSLYCSEHIKTVAGHYDQAVRALQKQAQANLLLYPKTGPLRQVGQLITEGLEELAGYLYHRYPAYLSAPASAQEFAETTPPNLLNKILCALSADQIGIMLKAAFSSKLILGKSFRMICKTVAPYLSTPWKENISWDTIRSISGRAEPRDKEIAISFLEKMIERIRE